MYRFVAIILLALLVCLTGPGGAACAGMTNHTSARQAVLMDFDTGMVLFEKNAHQRMPTSSMSKVMTMYMVFEALKDGRISLDDKFRVSEKAWRKGGSKMFVEVGKMVKIEDLIRGVIVQSGNDASIVLAEGLAGTEETFAESMTRRAAELGMKNSRFANASGWPDQEHYSTVYDLAVLARNLIRNFPDYYHYYSIREFTFNKISQTNRNPLLYRDIGADGIKTGHTEAGGYGLIASGTRNGRRVILVVNGLSDIQSRAEESARLLDWGLSGFHNRTLYVPGETVVSTPVVLGLEDEVPLTVAEEIAVTVPKISRKDMIVKAVFDGPVKAPVEKGARLGRLIVDIPEIDRLEIPLVAARGVPEMGFVAAAFERARLTLTGYMPDIAGDELMLPEAE